MCIFLDISAEAAAQRGGFGTEKYEKKEMQDRVRELFQTLRQKTDGEDFVVVDAGRSVEEVQESIRKRVQECIEKVDSESAPLRTVREW